MEEKKELLRIEHLTVSFAQYEKRSAKQGELQVIRDLNVTMTAKKYGQTIVMITHDDEIAQVADLQDIDQLTKSEHSILSPLTLCLM